MFFPFLPPLFSFQHSGITFYLRKDLFPRSYSLPQGQVLIQLAVVVVDMVMRHVRISRFQPLKNRDLGQMDMKQIQADGKSLSLHPLGKPHQAIRLFVKHVLHIGPKRRVILKQLSEILLIAIHPTVPIGLDIEIRDEICVDDHCLDPKL